MFPIYLLEEGCDIPEDDICYIIAKGGIYLKKKLDMVESVAKVSNISFLKDIDSYASIDLPIISGKKIAQVINFFRKVYREHRSEACVVLYYNEATNNIKIDAPKQEVSGASVDYESEDFENYHKVGTIHSHANFSAFHSGVDDADEFGFDGLHITLGHVGNDDHRVSVSCSIVVNGDRYIGDIEDYVEGLTSVSLREEKEDETESKKEDDDEDLDTVWGWGWRTSKSTKHDNRHELAEEFREIECNKKWLEKAEKKVYLYKYQKNSAYGKWGGESYSGGYGHYFGKPGGGGCYQGNVKKDHTKPKITTNNYKQGELFNPKDDKNIKYVPDADESPCDTCIHKCSSDDPYDDWDDDWGSNDWGLDAPEDAKFEEALDVLGLHGEMRDAAHAVHEIYPDLDPDEILECIETMEAI